MKTQISKKEINNLKKIIDKNSEKISINQLKLLEDKLLKIIAI